MQLNELPQSEHATNYHLRLHNIVSKPKQHLHVPSWSLPSPLSPKEITILILTLWCLFYNFIQIECTLQPFLFVSALIFGFRKAPELLHISVVDSFPLLYKTLLYDYTTTSLSIIILIEIDMWALFPISLLLETMLLLTFFVHVSWHTCSSIYVRNMTRNEITGSYSRLHSALVNIARLFYKLVLIHFFTISI